MYLFYCITNFAASIINLQNDMLNLCWFLNRFKIEDIPLEKHYKISASLKVCYGIGPCALDTLALIQNFKLPKTLCEWGTGFLSGLSQQSIISKIRTMNGHTDVF